MVPGFLINGLNAQFIIAVQTYIKNSFNVGLQKILSWAISFLQHDLF